MRALHRKSRTAVSLAYLALRRAWMRLFFAVWQPDLRLGRGVSIGRGVRIRCSQGGRIALGDRTFVEDYAVLVADEGELLIGKDCYVGNGVQIASLARIAIGDDVLIAQHCVIRDNDHTFQDRDTLIRLQGHETAPVTIGSDVWLGSNVAVTAGSSIGRGAVIGANAVVRGEIPDYSVAVGVPARVVKKRGEA